MLGLLVIIFVIKLYAQIDIFPYTVSYIFLLAVVIYINYYLLPQNYNLNLYAVGNKTHNWSNTCLKHTARLPLH